MKVKVRIGYSTDLILDTNSESFGSTIKDLFVGQVGIRDTEEFTQITLSPYEEPGKKDIVEEIGAAVV